ncbi:spore coat protein [Anaerocolumna sp. MB42-C2]|uniref:spore coat protein n=1 Tax=Anaerocolumna sp. MB42-C2 TaxID=3070997 RepID=UPI0027DF5F7E|nr:spore coat protein [Anaerocolumna sp. MB42-C2]WMJ89072.1 spore coat protein [Anaerocolumna sp. MB42-C2]
MQQQYLAPNETMQLHEILTLKNLCLTKSITMSPLISDEELKAIITNDIQKSVQHIKELKEYLEESMIASSGSKK